MRLKQFFRVHGRRPPGHTCARPPSTKSSVPFMKLAFSEARKATAFATSAASPKTTHRDYAGEVLKERVLVIRRHETGETRRRNGARAHDVDTNTLRGKLENPGPGKAPNGGFGRAVHAEARGSLPPTGRTGEGHGAAFFHQRQGLLHREE